MSDLQGILNILLFILFFGMIFYLDSQKRRKHNDTRNSDRRDIIEKKITLEKLKEKVSRMNIPDQRKKHMQDELDKGIKSINELALRGLRFNKEEILTPNEKNKEDENILRYEYQSWLDENSGILENLMDGVDRGLVADYDVDKILFNKFMQQKYGHRWKDKI